MRTVVVGGWILEVDKERTAAAYQDLPLISEECSCIYCLNFTSAYAHFPPTIKDFFEQFGIDPRKEGEVYQLYEYQENGEPNYNYAGFYHFLGRIVQAPPGAELLTRDSTNTELNFKVFEAFEASFNTANQLVPKGFPEPVVQLDFIDLILPLVV